MAYQNRAAKILIEDSKWIDTIKYDPNMYYLDVLTRTGKKYRYTGVGAYAFAQVVTSRSSGRAFNRIIKGKFSSRLLR